MQISALTEEVQEFKNIFSKEETLDLAIIVEKQKLQLQTLELKLEYEEKSKNLMMQELEGVCTSWQTLEEQKLKEIDRFKSMEDQIQKSKHEKMKAENKTMAIEKQLSALNNTLLSERKLYGLQLEQMKRFEEKEKSLTQLTVCFMFFWYCC